MEGQELERLGRVTEPQESHQSTPLAGYDNHSAREARPKEEPADCHPDSDSSSSSSSNSDAGQRSRKPTPVSESLRPLSSREALVRLHEEMANEIESMKRDSAKRSHFSWLLESISFKSELSKMRWPSVLFMTGHALAHFIVAFVLNMNDNLATNWIGTQGFILTSFLIFNLAVNVWDTKLRFQELLMKAAQVADLVERCANDRHLLKRWRRFNWKSAKSQQLFIPKSPCIHQTFTYRDQSCLNLPDYLLVRGDIVHLFPGERAPGDCISLTTATSSQHHQPTGERVALREDEIFEPPGEQAGAKKSDTSDTPSSAANSHATLKRAVKGTDFLMLSTPYLKSLRISLQQSHKRPVNSIEKECFIVSRKYFETYVIPLVFVLSTIVTALHYGYLDLTDSDHQIKTISIAYLLLRPSLTIMPFLPWMFPCFWMAVNAYGSARLLCCAEAQRAQASGRQRAAEEWRREQGADWDRARRAPSDTRAPKSAHFESLLATPTAAGSSDQNRHEEDELQELQNKIKFRAIFRTFVDLILGRAGHVWRSSSLLQVLGCLTSLCCIDKVGILSWSNPTPEKVLVLTRGQSGHAADTGQSAMRQNLTESRRASQSDELQSNFELLTGSKAGANLHTSDGAAFADNISARGSTQVSTSNLHAASMKHSGGQHRAEIIDVSQTFNVFRGGAEPMALHQETRLQFDEPNWGKFIDNLKPLGLAILMNNCCEKSFGDYFRFYKHICYESQFRSNSTPVVKRRCICPLSSLIGFSKDALKHYKYVNQIGLYKLIDPAAIKRDKLVSSLENTTRLKLPFSNMICNIHRDATTGSYQATSLGTADIVLDSCIDFWDGSQLVPLDEATRKKALDFYHRTSLTAYCAAFAYTPLLEAHDLGANYIEMPAENSRFAGSLRRLAKEQLEQSLHMQTMCSPPAPPPGSLWSEQPDALAAQLHSQAAPPQPAKRPPRRHLSADDLLQCATGRADRANGRPQSADRKSIRRRHFERTVDELREQIFVGMVALQYQACPDFVALVEQLEHACIRFVHFSKENELRSRVFSEKMGLESGWNCHISLQSDTELASQPSGGLLARDAGARAKDDSQSKALFAPSTRISNILIGSRSCKANALAGKQTRDLDLESNLASEAATLYSWTSLPSLVMRMMSRFSGLHKQQRAQQEAVLELAESEQLASSDDERLEQYSEADDEQRNADHQDESSTRDEPFDALAFDMSNRAKLPKGIENIRPHLETVDNIPLQVSLFTDCTPELSKEMIEIMQEYGEIVCVIGSASSRLNTRVFLQANASIAVEPLVPECCTQLEMMAERRAEAERGRPRKRSPSKSQRSATKETSAEVACPGVKIDGPLLRRPTSRHRLGIGSSARSSEHSDQLKRPTLEEPVASSSCASSTSSSSSSSGSASASAPGSPSSSSSAVRHNVSQLSQSLSATYSSSDSDSSTCSSLGDAPQDSMDALDGPSARDDDGHQSHDTSKSLVREIPNPAALAAKLASLPCSYNYNRNEPVHLYSLIMEARHFTFKMKNTFVCMICFALSISSAQFLASILFLPPMLSSGLTIWLTVVVVPLMSFSLMSTTMDTQVMKIAVGKNLQLKPENITFFVICYLIKFIPSIIVVVLNFGLIIAHSCKLTGFGSSSLGPCWMFTYVRHANSSSKEETGQADLLWSSHLLTAQVSAAFLMVLYFVVISSGFVHRSHLMWQRSPTSNHFWVAISLSLILCQLLFNQLVLQVNLKSTKIPQEFLTSLPLHIWLISFMWPILLLAINVLVKRAEIKATIRQQRRARFDFNTKLGMNSPF